MALLQTLKPFWPMLFTFVLPRAYGYYQALKTSARTRPPPRSVPRKARRSLNISFVAVVIFLYLSFDLSTYRTSNIFATTQTRLGVPSELLFTRLALLRPQGLTEVEDALRSKFNTLPNRQIYLRYGPDTLLGCPFCSPEDVLTYTLYAVPSQILAPHLLSFVLAGAATSRSLSGTIAAAFRGRAILTSIVMLIIDIYLNVIADFYVDATKQSPSSLYIISSIVRPLSLCLFHVLLAFFVYATATRRFILFPFLAAAADSEDPQEMFQQIQKLMNDSNTALQLAQMKLRGLSIVRSTIDRDERLSAKDHEYWRQVRLVEGRVTDGIDEQILEDEEVKAVMTRVLAGAPLRESGGVDVSRLRRDASGFVKEVTRGLETVGHDPTGPGQ